MARTLYVIVGAGASYDSTSNENVGGGARLAVDPYYVADRKTLRPPLVTELFEPRFKPTLDRYPIAQMAASDIRSKPNEAVAIEEFLRTRYRDSEDELDQRKFHAIHFYLQELLWAVSKGYTTHPDNYDRLITACMRLPSVVFVTLNYDTLLDDRLRIVSGPHGFTSMDSYIEPDRPWSLVKLHGSVDWGRHIEPTHDWTKRGPQLIFEPPAEIAIGRDFELRARGTVEEIRFESVGSRYYYPALSVPLGSPDEFSCPPKHVAHLRDSLAMQRSGIDVLMVGYSALDDEVLSLFAKAGNPLGTVGAVNQDGAAAQLTIDRVRDRVGRPMKPWISGDKFSAFVTGSGLEKFIAQLDPG